MNVADLHCDLLIHMQRGGSPFDPAARCSFPFLKEGGVKLQTLAAYTDSSPNSSIRGGQQVEIFKKLASKYPKELMDLKIILSIENASGLVEEEDPLDLAFYRLKQWQEEAGPILYLSLTWHRENRFGGGNFSCVGLKRDGELLLEALADRKICIDFSHASDRLAYDILEYIDKKSLPLIPIASHSNFRSIRNVERNLPDDLVEEIVKRKGVIGLNFVRAFVGRDPSDFIRHVEHAAKLGALESLCMGADFFCDEGLSLGFEMQRPIFFPGLDTASCYPQLLELLGSVCTREQLELLSHKTLLSFLDSRF